MKRACVALLFILLVDSCLSKLFHRTCIFLGIRAVSSILLASALAKRFSSYIRRIPAIIYIASKFTDSSDVALRYRDEESKTAYVRQVRKKKLRNLLVSADDVNFTFLYLSEKGHDTLRATNSREDPS